MAEATQGQDGGGQGSEGKSSGEGASVLGDGGSGDPKGAEKAAVSEGKQELSEKKSTEEKTDSINIDEHKKVLAELQKYRDAEKKSTEEKLKKDGEFQKLLDQRDSEIKELQQRETTRARTDNMRMYLKENKIPEEIINSDLPGQLANGDFFDDNNGVKKDTIKTLTKSYPFMVSEKKTTAQMPSENIAMSNGDINEYVERKVNEISKSGSIDSGTFNIDDFFKNAVPFGRTQKTQ